LAAPFLQSFLCLGFIGEERFDFHPILPENKGYSNKKGNQKLKY
jgi:hypothetical protein